jgi:RNA polymerase sigma-B factor
MSTDPSISASGACDQRLLRAYREHGDSAARECVIARHLPLVRRVARRYARHPDQVDELVQVGCIGLLKAIDRFEPDRGVQLRTYALPTIEGEVRHFLRDQSALLRLPAPVRELRQRLTGLSEELAQRLGREPSERELATAAGVDEEAMAEALRARSVVPLDPSAPELEPSAPDELDLSEERTRLAEAMRVLDDDERRIVYRRFFEDLTQEQIAGELDVSQAQVSRVLHQAIEKMRAELQP